VRLFKLSLGSLSLQQKFRNLSNRPPATIGLSDIVGVPLDLCPCIPHRDRQAGLAQNRNIGNVISDVCDGLILKAAFLLYPLINFEFFLHFLIDDSNSQFFGAEAHHFGKSAGNKPDLNASALQQRDTLAIADVKTFGFDTAIVNVNATVGKDAVYVEQQELDFSGFALDLEREVLHRDSNYASLEKVVKV